MADETVRVRGDAEEDILQVFEGWDVDQLAALDERIEKRGAAGAVEAPGKEPVLPTDRDDAELVLGAVVVDRHAPVVHESLQDGPLIREIADGVAQWRLREHRPRQVLAHDVDPRQQGRGLVPTQRPSAVGVEISACALNLIELLDEGHDQRGLRIGRQRFDTRASTVPGLSCQYAAFNKVIPNGNGGLFMQDLTGYTAFNADGVVTLSNHWFGTQGSWGAVREMVVIDQDTTAVLVRNTYSTEWHDEIFNIASNGYPIPSSAQGFDPEHEVTSMFAVKGGLAISLADGAVLGPDQGFEQMHLSHAQSVGHGRYVGGGQANPLVGMIGPNLLTNPSPWSQPLGQRASNAASPSCYDADLNDLIASYPYTTSTGIALPVRPKCADFTKDGAGSLHFLWEELNGHIFYDAQGNPKPSENEYDWAMGRQILRTGLDLTYEAVGGIRLSSTYRSPHQNSKITGHGTSSAHIWGVGADMKPAGAPDGDMLQADWNTFEQIVRQSGKAVWTEPYKDSKNHVHGSFEWWPGRPEFRVQQ